MKKRFVFVFCSVVLVLVLEGCSSSTGSEDTTAVVNGDTDPTAVVGNGTGATVSKVATYAPADLVSSGAPIAWKEADIAAATATIVDDPLVTSAMSAFTGLYGKAESARASTMTLQEAFDDMTGSIKDLPKTKSLDKTYDLSDKALNDYFYAKTLTSSLKTTIVTTDGLALDADEMTNFLSGTGKLTFNADISAVKAKIPAASSIKDVKIKINLGADAAVSSEKDTDGERVAKNLVFSYAASMSFGTSYNDGKVGGKLIITVTAAKPDTTIANPEADYDQSEQLKPSTFAIDITAYNDAGTAILTKNFATLDEFTTYINNQRQ